MIFLEGNIRYNNEGIPYFFQNFGHEIIVPFLEQIKTLFGIEDNNVENLSISSNEMSLSERIKQYGKIRFLFICDENLGRSRLFAAALYRLLKSEGLDEIAEAVSAGTDVEKKRSYEKYPDGLPAKVRNEIAHHGVTEETDVAKQIKDTMATPNTIAIVLNKPRKTKKSFRKKCFCSINALLNDPGRLKMKQANELYHLSLIAFHFNHELYFNLKKALEDNNLSIFRDETIDMNKYDIDEML